MSRWARIKARVRWMGRVFLWAGLHRCPTCRSRLGRQKCWNIRCRCFGQVPGPPELS